MSKLIYRYFHILVYEEVTNMTHIIDYQATQPINKTGETTFVIPHSPNKAILANIKLKISRKDSRDNRVEFCYSWG